MYQEKRSSQSTFIPIRGLRYHVRTWGTPDANASGGRPPLVMVHGWMDVAASFQFVVDAFKQDRWVISPDWRGYGLTESGGVDSYWFPDYLADLDFLLDALCPGQQVDLIGHSLGGNVAMSYAGVRPERLRKLINLEGFGMGGSTPAQAPKRYEKWIDELKALHKGDMALKPYDSAAGVASRLMKTNPRLSQDKADWLAQHWARPDEQGRWVILGDPAHKVTNANLSRVEEVLALYARISADTLVVQASDNSLDQWWNGSYTLAEVHERLKHVPRLHTALIDDAGHMLHHDQPKALAQLIEDFIG